MRSRNSASVSAFWWAVARLVKGKAARLRARRVGVETTTSDSGPVPRSHSPVVEIRLSRFIRAFLLADQVAQPGRLLEALGRRRLLEPPAQGGQLGLARRVGRPPRRLAGVPAGAV